MSQSDNRRCGCMWVLLQCTTAGLEYLASAGRVSRILSQAAETRDRYYAHPAVHDAEGVIAPWYTAQNGQLDFRIRVAAETLKRYPWTTRDNAADCVPHFLFSGHWSIAADGTITPLVTNDWDNGDLGQRAAYVLSGLVDYYRYSGDPAAIALMTLQADFLLDHCLTPADHPWPRFLISVPNQGKVVRPVRSAGHDSAGHRGRSRRGHAESLSSDRRAALVGGLPALGRSAGRQAEPRKRRTALVAVRQSRDRSLEG